MAALLAMGFGRRGGDAARRGPERRSHGHRAPDSREAGRGRSADTPSDIPARGWKDILIRVYRRISDDRVVALAAGVTFYALLAIFPAIAALVAIYGLFADPATISGQLSSLANVLPGGAIDVIGDQVNRVTSQGARTLGLAFVVGLGVSLWSANAGIKAIFDTLNIVYAEREKRGFIKLNAISLGFTLGAIVLLVLALVAVAVVPVLLEHLGMEGGTSWLINVLRWPAIVVAVGLAFAIVYRYGPSRAKAKWRWITWGSALASVVWLIASLLFSWYAAHFGSYNKTYGSLGAAIGFMTWMWISTIVLLIGAEIDAEMEHQTVRDTTVEGRRPLGTRGATMADTVGAAQE